jgi:hypothetical protein
MILGAIVSLAVGQLARVGGPRSAGMAMLIAVLFGFGGYAARYYFEFNDIVDSAVQGVADEAKASGVSPDQVRQLMLEALSNQYPPGGYVGYLRVVTESGFSIGRRGTGNADSDAPIKGGLAWGLLAAEALAAAIVAGFTARSIVNRAKAPAVVQAPTASTPGAPHD